MASNLEISQSVHFSFISQVFIQQPDNGPKGDPNMWLNHYLNIYSWHCKKKKCWR